MVCIFLLIATFNSGAQEIQRPAIWGIVKMTFLVSDFQIARDYYGKFLGFDKAFSYPSDLGKVTSFKVSHRQLIKYALSLKGPEVIVPGMDSIDIVKANLEILRSFRPLPRERMEELAQELTPFYNNENPPWMKPGYCDGNWA